MRWLLCLSLLALLLTAGVGTAGGEGPPLCQTDCATAIVPPVAASPFGITRGPLGSVWFSLDNAIGRIDQQGQITTYPVPTANAVVGWMTANPENSVWFAERGSGKIGRITTTGTITEFSLPTSTAVPQGIVFAPDGNIYVTEQGANAIARLNPTGQATDIPVPTPNSTTQSGALGPDGAIWFVERSAAKIGPMTLDGTFTEYPLTPGAFPNRIVAGPDGALWFTELRAGKIGRITTDGALTEYPIAGGPVGITVGRDRQLYVVLSNIGAVARLNLDGQVTGQWATRIRGGGGRLMLKLAFATGFAALAITGTAAATPPISTVVSADATFTNTFDCPFPLQETVSGSYRDTLYFDAAGNPVKEILTAQFGGPLTVTWINLATGSTLSSNEAAPLIVYYNPDGSFASLQNVGLIFNVTVPGQGTVLLDVGRIVIVRHQGIVFEAAPHQEENGDTAAFCAALT